MSTHTWHLTRVELHHIIFSLGFLLGIRLLSRVTYSVRRQERKICHDNKQQIIDHERIKTGGTFLFLYDHYRTLTKYMCIYIYVQQVCAFGNIYQEISLWQRIGTEVGVDFYQIFLNRIKLGACLYVTQDHSLG